MYEVLLAFAGALVHQLVDGARRFALGAVGFQAVAELHDKLAQGFQLLRVGVFVDAVGQGLWPLALFHLAHAFGHGLVGEQHKLFDKLVGVLRPLEVAAHGLALVVHVEVQLFAVELHRAVGEPLLAQLLGQAVELDQLVGVFALVAFGAGLWRGLPRSVLHAVVFEQLLHLLVGVAAVAANDGVDYAVAAHVGLVVEVEHHAERQFLLVGAQRADEVAQPLGQHRYGAVHEVHAGGAFLGFAVDDGAFFHVVGNVGYVHAHFPQAVVEAAYGQRVVEVLGVAGVDGAGEHVAEVFALGHVVGRYFAAYLLGRVFHGFRILVGQAVLGEDGVHFHVVVARWAEHVGHFANHVAVVGVGPFQYFHHRLVARLGPFQLALGYYYRCGQVAVGRREERQPVVLGYLPYEGRFGPLQYFYHLRFADVPLAPRHEGELHAVAGHGEHRVALGHEHWRAVRAVGHHRVLSVRLALEGAFLHLPLGVEAVRVVRNAREEVVPSHFFHRVDGQHLHRVGL